MSEEQQVSDGLISDAPLENPEAAAAVDDPEKTVIPHVAETPADAGAGERPEWLPEKFWDADKGVQSENLAKSYAELEKKFRQGKPEVPDAYDMSKVTDAGVPQDDPVLNTYAEWAKDAGISQEHFDALASKVLKNAGEQQTEAVFDREAEINKLGANGQEVVDEYLDWARKVCNPSKGMFGQDDWEEFKAMGGTAEGIKTMNKLRRYYGDMQRLPTNVQPVEEALPSKDECYAMVADPRYNTDPGYRKKVENIFARVFGNQPDNRIVA